MALVKFINGESKHIAPEAAAGIWYVLTGEEEGSAEQQKYCLMVKQIYFDWRSAPNSWVQKNFDFVKEVATVDWAVCYHGKPTKPSNDWDWQYAKKHGLTKLIDTFRCGVGGCFNS